MGPSVPPQLVTREFFEITSERLTDNGVLMFNAIGSLAGYRADMIGALYNTIRAVFPQVYLFPARESVNVVFLATRSTDRYDAQRLLREGQARLRDGTVQLPTFIQRLHSLFPNPPPTAAVSPILTDSYAPIQGLIGITPQHRLHPPTPPPAQHPPPR
jgi:spermidine synthase